MANSEAAHGTVSWTTYRPDLLNVIHEKHHV